MKIVIVEDDEGSRVYLARALQSQGHAVESAANGVQALKKIEQAAPDLIISDIMMPEMDGFELCRRLKTDARLHAIPFLFYTATFVEQKDQQLAMALGASRYLIKPMELDALLREIKAVTDESLAGNPGSPLLPHDAITELDRMQLEVLARKLDKKVRELGEEREALRRSEGRYHRLLDSMMDGFVYVDMDGRILEYNNTFKRMLGYSDDELRTLSSLALTPDKWHAFEHKILNEQILKQGFSEIYNKEYRRKDGSLFPVELHAFLIKDLQDNHEGMWAVVRDISERKKIEEEKKKLEVQLLQAQKMEAIGTLTGGIAHDFNNMLSAIVGYGQLTLMKMEKDNPFRMHVEHMLESADRAAALTHSLLTFSRKQITNREPVDLNDIIQKVEKFLARVIGEDVVVRLALAKGALTTLADAGQLEQVFMNLATNARDAMPNGGLFTIETSTVELDDGFVAAYGYGTPGNYVLIEVSDTGVGMNEETLEKIFEPFFTTKEVGKGTGLGLAMVYGILKQNQGFIHVYSEPGKGTTFRIYFPLIKAAAVEARQATAVEYPKGGTETILLAEDDPTLRKLTVLVLEQMGYTVLVANDGVEAVTKFMENKDRIQLLLFDLIMPKKSGRDAYEEIKKVRPHFPVIFASGYSPEMLREKALIEEGAVMIYKPVAPQNLLKKVRDVLDRRQPAVP